MAYCSNCGHKLLEGAKFCSNCGESVIIETKGSKGLKYDLSSDGTAYSVVGFDDCKENEIIIPNSYNNKPVTSIKKSLNITNIVKIFIPETIENIDVFAYCPKLTHIEVASENPRYKSIDGNLYTKDGKTFIRCPESKMYTSFIMPNGVERIEALAFSGCKSLTSVEIPDSVTNIGESVFDGCSKLTHIEVASENPRYKSIDGNLYTKDGKTIIKYGEGKPHTVFSIPNGVEKIEDSAFAWSQSLTSIEIPDSVTNIGWYAFEHCYGLTSVEIPDSVTNIEEYAFNCCSGLTSIAIGKGVESIGESAFELCYKLANIEVASENPTYRSIEGSLYTKDGKTFIRYVGDKAKERLIIPIEVERIADDVFSWCDNEPIVYYEGSLDEWHKIENNDKIAFVTYYSKDPSESGWEYWHYDKDGEIERW